MIELRITHTAREAGRGKAWYRTAETTERFATLKEATGWCRASLGRRCVPMYRDTTDGQTHEAGRVYSAQEREGRRTYYKQYWVSVYDVTPRAMR
jgi:hypothetical protein